MLKVKDYNKLGIKMKKIYYIIILITGTIISCNNSSSGDYPEGYVDPGLVKRSDLSAAKGYNNIDVGCQDCPRIGVTSEACKAVIYQGTLNNGIQYIGIAIDDDSGFNLKIYWTGDSTIPNSKTLDPGNYFIKIVNSSGTYDSPTGSMVLDINNNPADPSGKVYEITFTSGTTINGGTTPVTINNGATINAYLYP